jgi:PAS domain S-box-containing protein
MTMKWFPKKRIVAGFGLSLAILITIGVVSYKSELKYIDTSRLVVKTQMILKKLEIVLTMITNAETGQRGYIITGDDRYLEPYHVAIANIGQEIKKLRGLTYDKPIQQRRLDALEPLLAEKLKGLKERIDLRKNKGFEVAAQEVRTGKGRMVMDKIRKLITEMEDDERELLKQKTAEAEINARRMIFIITSGSLLAFMIVAIAVFVTYRELTSRKRAEEALKKAYAEMEQKVEERTTELHAINESLQREITERKQIEEKLETASNEWRATFDSATDLIIFLDSEMRIIKTNFATTKFLNRPFNEILGKNCFQLFHGTDRPLATCPTDKMRMTKKHEEVELYLPEKDIWILVSADPIFDDKGNLTGSVHIIRDITEHKRAEKKLQTYQEQLRSLASQLSLIEERERRRIAIDLHDHIGQTLALCKIKLGALRESTPTNLIESLDEIRDLTEQIIRYTRSLTFELSPPILYDLGFEAAVEWLGEEILKEHGILFHFKNDEQPKSLNDEARVLLFQAVRELLVNIAKHAQAREAKVSIQKVGDDIRINIEDDGIGFDTSKIDSYLRSGCFGLFSIRERLNRMGGYLEIESEPGKGTRIYIIAPLSPKSKNGRVI